MKKNSLISLVIPIYNESANIRPLYNKISKVAKINKLNIEIIFINDGSTDNTQEIIEKICSKDKKCIGIQLRIQMGKATALRAGFNQASGGIIITLDGDMQDDPHEIPKFINKVNQGYDLVSGWKKIEKIR